MQRPQAIIFDLYGTLIDNYSVEDYRVLCRATAEILGVDEAEFYRLWEPTFARRARGIEGDSDFYLREVCSELGADPSEEQMQEVLEVRLNWARRFLVSRPWSSGVLARLRVSGFPLWLVCDCSWELPRVWPHGGMAEFFQAVVFSCEEGTKKPDPQLFLKATTELGVEPGQCMYVGDGGGSELSATRALGMRVIQLEMPNELDVVSGGYPRETWDGERIAHIEELLELLEL